MEKATNGPPSSVSKAISAPAVLVMRLYIAGNAPNSLTALANIKTICDKHFPHLHELEIIDVLKDPRRALADGIIVTPTLVKLSPQPVQRVIGNLNDSTQVMQALVNK